jgi:hypothetical protein
MFLENADRDVLAYTHFRVKIAIRISSDKGKRQCFLLNVSDMPLCQITYSLFVTDINVIFFLIRLTKTC